MVTSRRPRSKAKKGLSEPGLPVDMTIKVDFANVGVDVITPMCIHMTKPETLCLATCCIVMHSMR